MLPLIVYFPDSSQWLSRAAPKSSRKEFVQKVQQMFDKLSGPIVLICGQNKVETNAKEKEKFVWPILLWLENLFFSHFTNIFPLIILICFADNDTSKLWSHCEAGEGPYSSQFCMTERISYH